MATAKPTAPRRQPQKLSLADQLAHDYNMSVMKSTAAGEILEEDGNRTARLIYLGREYSRMFRAGMEGGV
jgi:hypothetical protein